MQRATLTTTASMNRTISSTSTRVVPVLQCRRHQYASISILKPTSSSSSSSSSSLSLSSSRSFHSTPSTSQSKLFQPTLQLQRSIPKTNTISASEIAHFSSLAEHWWNPTGEFKLLHLMNQSRIQFLKDRLLRVNELDFKKGKWLDGISVLDVGCGGGIFAESLARLGASTTAIDASSVNIKTAALHSSLDHSLMKSGKLNYQHCAAEDLVLQGKQFDVVCAMEVIEHVEDPRGFLKCLAQLTKPGGQLLISTISRTPLAHFLTITLAEHLLRFVTPGTHTYSKYIKPTELQHFFEDDEEGLKWEKGSMERRGCLYDPLKGDWTLLGMGEWNGLGEGANYFAGIRRPL